MNVSIQFVDRSTPFCLAGRWMAKATINGEELVTYGSTCIDAAYALRAMVEVERMTRHALTPVEERRVVEGLVERHQRELERLGALL